MDYPTIIKSLLTSLYQREDFPSLEKRGAGLWLVEPTAHRGDFLVNVYSIMRLLIKKLV